MAESQIDPRRSFADHGLDSLAAVQLAAALSERLGRVLDETLLWNFATIEALVAHLEATAPAAQTRASERRGPAGSRQEGSERAAPAAPEGSIEDEVAKLERELKQR
jgi:acyl carrier protein